MDASDVQMVVVVFESSSFPSNERQNTEANAQYLL
jgi:hypothetical protein